jgi:hypothetical protein
MSAASAVAVALGAAGLVVVVALVVALLSTRRQVAVLADRVHGAGEAAKSIAADVHELATQALSRPAGSSMWSAEGGAGKTRAALERGDSRGSPSMAARRRRELPTARRRSEPLVLAARVAYPIPTEALIKLTAFAAGARQAAATMRRRSRER